MPRPAAFWRTACQLRSGCRKTHSAEVAMRGATHGKCAFGSFYARARANPAALLAFQHYSWRRSDAELRLAEFSRCHNPLFSKPHDQEAARLHYAGTQSRSPSYYQERSHITGRCGIWKFPTSIRTRTRKLTVNWLRSTLCLPHSDRVTGYSEVKCC
jgi:hypothetical protein